ncbi:YbhB/YbcL family Raf kinase inhibitor-like protein [Massilia sp. CF038]|uniref:YbhB/YbcL family Raf kinase inhibitor-like protein n=1 Tax=Massilia sp. CF038 TaxID=1881045 RepID=UPI00091C957D|nr:YbhB/YbcL family Raf kinase inhibitor-like protein [Massilia sp. CF038]SHG61651.1 Raf kinase inhibitor-like protein, YbhB/YbcL family [Massilia sp. CF038]
MTSLKKMTALTLALAASGAFAQQGDGTQTWSKSAVVKPDKVPASDARIKSLRVAAGFQITVFAKDLKNARMVAVAPNGTVYVSRRDQGDVILLQDANQDGKADGPPVTVANRAGLHGLAIKDNKMYLATVKEVFVSDILADGRLGPQSMIIDDLPDSGQHPNRTMAFGPDGMLYITVGSTCNGCNESNPENATVLRASPDGKSRTIFASGLRNTIGIDWHPVTGELWGLDHGLDTFGDDVQAEELNKLELGKQYGWPHVFGAGEINPQTTPPGEISKAEWKAQSVAMALGYTAHAAPMQLVFYTGTGFPQQFQGDAFATMRGSWNRSKPSGYELVRIHFNDGKPQRFEPFVTGFLTDGGRTHFARPVGLAQAKDGALLMSDDANGVLYRIAYSGNEAKGRAALGPAPAGPMQAQAAAGNGGPLAKDRPDNAARQAIAVTSSAFPADGQIPKRTSEYADGVSPPLQWNKVEGAKSYVVIAEDPDAKPITPFVHWLAWNIPRDVTALPEGLQEQPRLTEPPGVLQGRNSRGSIAYYGPRPPVGDAPHRYYFQVFALDRLLDVPFGADKAQLLAAMRGHVLAQGHLVGQYQQREQSAK